MYEKNPESEIVIKITPKNLERLIYILVIVGLVIFSIVEFNKKIPDCPAVNCTNATASTVVVTTTPATPVTTPATNGTTANALNISTPITGNAEFLLTSVTLCVLNETEDKGRLDTVSVFIKNGMNRIFNGRLDIYEWDSNDDESLKVYPAQKIDKIRILAGNTLTHVYDMTGGMFTELDEPKNVKVVLVDTDLNTVIGTQTKQDIEATQDC